MQWSGKSDELRNIMMKYHITEYGHHRPVIRITIEIRLGMLGKISVMRGSRDDCFVQNTIIDSDQSENLIHELKPHLGIGDVETLKLRVAPDEIPHAEASFYVR